MTRSTQGMSGRASQPLHRYLLLGVFLAACSGSSSDDDACPANTFENDEGDCESTVRCGAGTIQQDNVCEPEAGASCGEGTSDNGEGLCVPDDSACAEGTVLVDGTCVPGEETLCGDGTELIDGECVIIYEMVCGEGTYLDEATNSCVPICVAGEYWDVANQLCVDECGAGTVFDADAGVCTPECADTLYYAAGVGCLHVPLCADGSEADPVTGDCEGFPFDTLDLNTLCAQRAFNRCENHEQCCGNFGPVGSDPFDDDQSFLDLGIPADMAGCINRELTFCELDSGVAAQRFLVAEGHVTLTDEGQSEFAAAYTYDTPHCVTPLSKADGERIDVLDLFQANDREIVSLATALTEPALADGEDCTWGQRLEVSVCQSTLCVASGSDEFGPTYRCEARIGLPTYEYDPAEAPLDEELCSTPTIQRSSWCGEALYCLATYYTEEASEAPYYFCVGKKSVGERCEEFADENPCLEGLVCRRDGGEPVATCQAQGTEDQECTRSVAYETCAPGHYCSNFGLCETLLTQFDSCTEDRECESDYVCRPGEEWEDSEAEEDFTCRDPMLLGEPCAAEAEYASWCGPGAFCRDEANNCDETEPRSCITELNVGNCVFAADVDEGCDICDPEDIVGCHEALFCTLDSDGADGFMNVCLEGVSVCLFPFSDVMLWLEACSL